MNLEKLHLEWTSSTTWRKRNWAGREAGCVIVIPPAGFVGDPRGAIPGSGFPEKVTVRGCFLFLGRVRRQVRQATRVDLEVRRRKESMI
jgi:hypothetical protein